MSAIRSGNVRAGWAHSVRDSVIGQVVGGVALAVVDETVFVGPGGSKDIEVLLSTKLLVKVSTGTTCPP